MGDETAVEMEFNATMTSDGQFALPLEVRELWGLKPGDQVSVRYLSRDEGPIRPLRRRSIFERLDELKLPSLGGPLTQQDIEDSIAKAMDEQEERSRGT